MVHSQLRLARLHHLHKQLFRCLPPALIPVRRRQIGHAGQCGRMVHSQLRLARLYHLHVQLFRCLPPALILKRRR
jgi:hypothetical protein